MERSTATASTAAIRRQGAAEAARNAAAGAWAPGVRADRDRGARRPDARDAGTGRVHGRIPALRGLLATGLAGGGCLRRPLAARPGGAVGVHRGPLRVVRVVHAERARAVRSGVDDHVGREQLEPGLDVDLAAREQTVLPLEGADGCPGLWPEDPVVRDVERSLELRHRRARVAVGEQHALLVVLVEIARQLADVVLGQVGCGGWATSAPPPPRP